MITFGLTGGIASGKSTVSRTLRECGIPVVDADIVARQVVEPGSNGLFQIINSFGQEFLNSEGELDRAALGNLVFKNPVDMLKLTKIMSPLIDEESAKQIQNYHQNYEFVCYDAALIIENNNADKYRPLILVSCPQEIQIQRLMKRNNLSHEQAMDRIKSQFSLEIKAKYADYIIDTSGSIDDTRVQTISIINSIRGK